MKPLVGDLHIHSGLKGYANHEYPENGERTIWDYYPEKTASIRELNFMLRDAIRELAKSSQAHLDACVEANLKAPFLSIYPVERQLFAPSPQKPFRMLLQLILKEHHFPDLGAAVSGFPRARVEKILENTRPEVNDGVNYFEQYGLERLYLEAQTATTSKKYPNHRFRLATDFEEFERYAQDEHTICGILTVEGAHAFGYYKHHSTFQKEYEQLEPAERQMLEDTMLSNIRHAKQDRGGKLAPLFVTFCHHFNNLLAGHARSLSGKSNLIKGLGWPNLPGMRHLFDQEPNLNKGFTPLGRKAVDLFLDRQTGRRILLDVKHMSPTTRAEYYAMLRERRAQGDAVPVICSHAAVSGIPSLDEAARLVEDEHLDKGAFFSRWGINTTDEDIVETFRSRGIIGLVMHEGRMPGDAFKEQAKKYRKQYEKNRDSDKPARKRKAEEAWDQLRDMALQLLWSNIFHIVRVVRQECQADGWELIALGSDFDGLIDPFNAYTDVLRLPELYRDLTTYLEAGKPIYRARRGEAVQLGAEEIQALLNGRSPGEILDMIFFGNVHLFLSRYFHEAYLRSQPAGPPGEAGEIA